MGNQWLCVQVSYAIHQAACEALAEAEEPRSPRGKGSTPRKRPRREGAASEAGTPQAPPSDSGAPTCTLS